MAEADEPATVEVHIQATLNGHIYDLGTATATEGDRNSQLAGLLRDVASELETPEAPRPRPDQPAATHTEH